MKVRTGELPEGFQTRYFRESTVLLNEDGKELVAHGRAIPFGLESDDLGGFVETINKDVEINNWRDDVFGLKDHNWGQVLGRLSSGTLELDRRDDGLYSTYHLPNNTLGMDLSVSLTRGDIDGQSFGFIPTRETWEFLSDENGELDKVIVDVKEMTLFETTITPIPAYTDSFVGLDSRVKQFQAEMRRVFSKASSQRRRRQLDMMGRF